MGITYDRHDDYWKEILEENSPSAKITRTWFDKNTLDYCWHMNMVRPFQPLIDVSPNDKWLTVGDGRYGLDAKEDLGYGDEGCPRH